MAGRTIKRSITMSVEMSDLLAQAVAKRGREVTVADLIREAIRLWLDEQADIVGSRRHFHKSLQARLDRLETALTFQMTILIELLAVLHADEAAVHEAIIAAKRHNDALQRQIAAVRDLKVPT